MAEMRNLKRRQGNPDEVKESLRGLLDFTPAGDALAIKEGVQGLLSGDYPAAIGGAVAALPFVPGTVGKAAKEGAKRLFKAPQDDALRVAQENGVKMLGLPPNNTPMDRARAMGFPEDSVYRGHQFGSGRNKNTFYASNPDLASEYAARDADINYEKISGGERYVFQTLEDAKKSDTGGRLKKLNYRPTVQQDLVRSEKPLVIDAEGANWQFIKNPFVPPENHSLLQKKLDEVTGDLVLNGRVYTAQQQRNDIIRGEYHKVFTNTNTLADLARKNGFDSVVINNLQDVPLSAAQKAGTLMSDVTIALKPQNIRSRFAAFDPARINENNLLASLAALGIGLPLAGGLLATPEGD